MTFKSAVLFLFLYGEYRKLPRVVLEYREGAGGRSTIVRIYYSYFSLEHGLQHSTFMYVYRLRYFQSTVRAGDDRWVESPGGG